MQMQKFSGFLPALVLVSLSAALSAQSREDPLVGRWRSAVASPAGLSAVFEFHAGDQFDSWSAVASEGTYRLVGTDTVVLKGEAGTQKLEVEWDNQDRARLDEDEAEKYTDITRVGTARDSRNALAGEWTCVREWKGGRYPARVFFMPDGRVIWVTILRVDHGTYAVTGKTIRFQIPGRPLVEGEFSITGDRLTLPSPRGNGLIFKRF
jgi:hypothetical protein